MPLEIYYLNERNAMRVLLAGFKRPFLKLVRESFPGREVALFSSAKLAIEAIKDGEVYYVIVCESYISTGSGFCLFRLPKNCRSETEVILIAENTDVIPAVLSMKIGAFDHLIGSSDNRSIVFSLRNALNSPRDTSPSRCCAARTD